MKVMRVFALWSLYLDEEGRRKRRVKEDIMYKLNFIMTRLQKL